MVTLRFYEELNDLLPRKWRRVDFQVPLKEKRSVKDLIESLGVPHTEVDLILANGESVDFSYSVQEKDRLSVYPAFESLNIKDATRLRRIPLRKTRFIADSGLEPLVRLLRVLGFDICFDTEWAGADVAKISNRESRIILTQSRSLLKFRDVTHGMLIRPGPKLEQVRSILQRLDIRDQAEPFSRCVKCNGLLKEVAKEKVIDRIPRKTRGFCSKYSRCVSCGKLYWDGTHRIKMEQTVRNLLNRS
ncbi:MAG: Mut7-C RNAse domain-containing protein [Acidobacteriota bacterium]